MENKNGGKPTSRSSSRSFRRQNRQDALICSHWVHCACLMARWWKDVERFGVWLVTVVTVKHVMFHKMFLGNVGWNTTVPPGPWGRTYSAWTNTSWWPRQMLSDTASPSFQSTFRALQRSEAKSSRSLFDFFDPLVSNVFAMQIATDRTNETDWNSQSEVNQKSTLNEFKTLQSLHCSVSIEVQPLQPLQPLQPRLVTVEMWVLSESKISDPTGGFERSTSQPQLSYRRDR
jgi:hypothetical protein